MASSSAAKVGVFHPGTQHARQTALAFQEAGQLGWYAASYDPPSRFPRIERLLTRQNRASPRESVSSPAPFPDPALVRRFATVPWLETAVGRLGERAAAWSNLRGHKRFVREILKLVEREPVDVLWGYDGCAVEIFRWAKQRGIRCVLDQASIHSRVQNDVLAAEQDRHPDFFPLDYAPLGRDQIARQDEELALADLVVVGSEFCARTLRENGCDPGKIRVVPCGYDDDAFPAARINRAPPPDRPAQMLFVGAVSAANGIAYLLDAFRLVLPERATLTLVGTLSIPGATFARYGSFVDHVPYLPHSGVIHHLLAADAFVFPTLFEGRGLALCDALGAGLGIIQSSNADIPTVHGRNGIVLDQVSTEGLAQALEDALNPRERLAQWGRESWHMRPERSWTTYRRAVVRVVTAI